MRAMRILAVIVAITFVVGVIGCSSNRANTPSYKDAVRSSLDQAGFKDVKVSEDRDKGVITLDGKVQSEDDKNRAEETAKSAAPGVIVANQISIEPAGAEGDAKKIESNIDDGIEKNFKAALIGNKLDNQHIRFDSKNGVLTLKGDVDNMDQRQQAEKVAASVPNVSQVVNELQVKGMKHGKSAGR